jgi:nucleotide-binding universal stress UspA family protein
MGDPGREIVRAAQEWHADLIVLGTHGRNALGRLMMGSTAEAVFRHAPCPVLLVRQSPADVAEAQLVMESLSDSVRN